MRFRIASWNLHMRVGDAATRQADLLRRLSPDIALLQEVSRVAINTLVHRAGFRWMEVSRPSPIPGSPQRIDTRLTAIAGRIGHADEIADAPALPFASRAICRRVEAGDLVFVAASYHAPPGVSWGRAKVDQALVFAEWLSRQHLPMVLGADANTPKVDAVDFRMTKTHWHTGRRILAGGRGDDVLWGPDKAHSLEDALRLWLTAKPQELDAIRMARPNGPLAVSHRTGRFHGSPGFDRRFDSIWVSREFAVRDVRYLYEAGVNAGSDHAVVVAELE